MLFPYLKALAAVEIQRQPDLPRLQARRGNFFVQIAIRHGENQKMGAILTIPGDVGIKLLFRQLWGIGRPDALM